VAVLRASINRRFRIFEKKNIFFYIFSKLFCGRLRRSRFFGHQCHLPENPKKNLQEKQKLPNSGIRTFRKKNREFLRISKKWIWNTIVEHAVSKRVLNNLFCHLFFGVRIFMIFLEIPFFIFSAFLFSRSTRDPRSRRTAVI